MRVRTDAPRGGEDNREMHRMPTDAVTPPSPDATGVADALPLSPPQAPVRRRLAFLLLLLWTATLAASLLWNLQALRRGLRALGEEKARNVYRLHVLYRQWAALHGGVYAPVTDATQPNPHLDVPERDITTPSGRELTLINPAYMTRQVFALQEEVFGVRQHLASLDPLAKANRADAWESRALEAFERGEEEFLELFTGPDGDHVRLMRPLRMEPGCLQCHAEQGYKVGDVRGGISVSVPLAPLQVAASSELRSIWYGHLGVWLAGCCGIVGGWLALRRRDRAQEAAAATLLRFRRALDRTPDMVFLVDADQLRFVDVNETACRMLRMQRERLLQCGPPDIDTEARPEQIRARVEGAVGPGRDQTFETTFRAADGTTVPVELSLHALESGGERQIGRAHV